MTVYKGSEGRTSALCVDKDPETVPGEVGDINVALFHLIEATCNGLQCPSYARRERTDLCSLH